MNYRRLPTILLALHYTVVRCTSQTGTSTSELFKVTHSVQMTLTTGEPVGVWKGGALLTVENAKSKLPVFHTFDATGKNPSEVTLNIPGASLVNVYAGRFARGYDGSIVVVGTAYTDKSQGATFLALISSNGQQQKLIQLSPFVANAVTVAGDGTIWTAGFEQPSWNNSNEDIIRRFDQTGRMIASVFPRRNLPVKPGYANPAHYSYLVSSKDRIGWYSEATGTYIEFSLDGAVVGRFSTPPVSGMPGIALCDDGNLFVSSRSQTSAGPGWGIYMLARDRGEWNFLPMRGKWGVLFGCDGSRPVSTTDLSTVTWLTKQE